MRKIKKYLSIYLSIFVIIVSCYKPITAYAANSFSMGSINIDGQLIGAYVYSDPTLLPNQKQVYWALNGRVEHAPYTKALILQLNKGLGLTFKDSWFTDLWSWMQTNIFISSTWLTAFVNEGIYLVSNGNAIVGVALNDISGLQLSDDNSNNDQITFPSGFNNITYNIVNEYMEYNPETPDLISFETANGDYILNDWNSNYGQSNYENTESFVNGMSAGGYYFNWYYHNRYGGHLADFSNNNGYCYNSDVTYGCFKNVSDFNSLVTNYGLSKDNYFISIAEIRSYSGGKALSFNLYDSNLNQVTSLTSTRFDGTSSNVSLSNQNMIVLGSTEGNLIVSNNGSFTVYKTVQIPTQITNNTYSQNIYKSNTWNNYNPQSTTNNFNTTYSEINNAQNTNYNIYNQTKETTNNNTENNNFNYNYESNNNTTEIIINNYYGDSGSGGDDDDDEDDDSIWDALLKALGDFLKKIGELLATILTGIISICTSVLDAIASIAESFTGITDFIASIFAFIPSDIVAVLTLGITLAVLISLIKIFRG